MTGDRPKKFHSAAIYSSPGFNEVVFGLQYAVYYTSYLKSILAAILVRKSGHFRTTSPGLAQIHLGREGLVTGDRPKKFHSAAIYSSPGFNEVVFGLGESNRGGSSGFRCRFFLRWNQGGTLKESAEGIGKPIERRSRPAPRI